VESCLTPTRTIESDHPTVVGLASDLCAGIETADERAVRLFEYVRDEIRYTVHVDFADIEAYRATATLRRGEGFCVPKSILLVALLRSQGIPARLHFADLRNRLVPDDLRELMGTDIFYFHGYVELFLDGQWLKVTPSFDPVTCQRRGIVPSIFDGRSDALLSPTDVGGRPQFEYLRDRGTRDDLPFEEVLSTLYRRYPHYQPDAWQDAFVKEA